MSPEVSRLALRAVGAPLFIIGGAVLILMSALGAAPSMWYFFCYCALPVVGIVWLWRPSLAAALSIGPLISLVALMQYVPGMWASSRSWAAYLIAGLIAAVTLVVGALRGFRKWQRPVVLSLLFVTSAFATDRLFTNKTSIRSYQMYVAINGHAPWGDVGSQWSGESQPSSCIAALGTAIATMPSNQENCANGSLLRTVALSKWSTTFLGTSARSEATTSGRLMDSS